MKTSESIKEIAGALTKAQGAMGGAKKDSTNPHFKSRYADLSSIIEALQGPLAANGLSYTQCLVTTEKNECGVETLLMHTSGEWISYPPYFIPVSKADAQGFGSAATYACRYQLRAVFGLPTIDDDGNAAAAAKPSPADAYLNKDRPNNGAQVGKDAFDSLDTDTKDYLTQHANSIIALFEKKGDMAGFIKMQEYDMESKLALWSLLPSNVRSEIKRQQAKPALAEQG